MEHEHSSFEVLKTFEPIGIHVHISGYFGVKGLVVIINCKPEIIHIASEWELL